MARRGITAEMVREVLRAPQAVMPGHRPGRQVFQAAARIGQPMRRLLLRVVVDVGQDPPAVTTIRSEIVKVTYDAETGTLTVLLRDAPAHTSEKEKSGVILDYDADDRLIAIEILDASTRLDGVDIVQLQVTAKPGAARPQAAE